MTAGLGSQAFVCLLLSLQLLFSATSFSPQVGPNIPGIEATGAREAEWSVPPSVSVLGVSQPHPVLLYSGTGPHPTA